jgi:3-dehydroquinate dehydratase II
VRVLVLNGPNLGRLGTREPEIYGTTNLDDLAAFLRSSAPDTTIDLRQSDDEAELIAWLHEAVDTQTPVILNPAAFSHYSYARRDAVALVTRAGVAVIEVHISNPYAREEFRHISHTAGVSTGIIAGLGIDSYRLALDFIGSKGHPPVI